MNKDLCKIKPNDRMNEVILGKYAKWENNRRYNCRNIPSDEIDESINIKIHQMKNQRKYLCENIWNELNLDKRWNLNNNKWGIEQNSLKDLIRHIRNKINQNVK